jgi:hypothetical protein
MTNSDSVTISYQVLSTDASDTFEVVLNQDGVQVDSATVTTPLGGSGSFVVNDLDDGSYTFEVVADNSDDLADKTNTQSIEVDTVTPLPVDYEGVVQDGNDFILRFTVPSGSDGTVNIYSSTNLEFTADDSTLVGSLTANPGSVQSFVYTAADDSARYFAIQVVDAAGNVSEFSTDTQTVVSDVASSTSSVAASDEESGDGEVLGEDGEASDADEDATDQTGDDEQSDDDDDDNAFVWVAGIGLVVLVAGYIFRQRGSAE